MPPQPQPQPRPKSHLLIPSKRSLHPISTKKPLNPSSKPADIVIKPLSPSSSPSVPNKKLEDSSTAYREKRAGTVTVEVDLASAPQPFLDPGVWMTMMARRGGSGERAG